MSNYTLAIHGGAGTILRSDLSAEVEKNYSNALRAALVAGQAVLEKGGQALDAVVAAVAVLEDSPLFNAAKGAVFSNEGRHELEASLMCGKTMNAGAAAGVSNVKNPIKLSEKILWKDEFVYLSGKGAERFALQNGLEIVDQSYFFTQARYDQWQEARKSDKILLDHDGSHHQLVQENRGLVYEEIALHERKFGTVGAVAKDMYGNLAAGTSTGGLTNKKFGRLGDSSVIGIGTYANNNTCAVSCTGYGEYFLRAVVAYDISCLMEYKGMSLKEACNYVVKDKLVKFGGEGGVIAVDTLGNAELCFNSEGMYRGSLSSENPKPMVAIYEAVA